jgi:hypothetical protein
MCIEFAIESQTFGWFSLQLIVVPQHLTWDLAMRLAMTISISSGNASDSARSAHFQLSGLDILEYLELAQCYGNTICFETKSLWSMCC